MSRTGRICAVMAAAALIGHAQQVSAGNTSVEGVSARARAVGNAFTAIADDASAVYYNPAGLVQVNGSQLLTDVMSVSPRLIFDADAGRGSTSSRGALAPGLFFASDAVPGVWLGVGLFAPFAREASYHALGGQRHKASFLRTDLAPTAAFELGENWALGLGLTASRIGMDAEVLGLKQSARGYGFSGQLGLLYRGFDRVQLGLSYRGRMRAAVEGRGSIAGVARDKHSSSVRFPDVLSAGVAWRASERWTFSANFDWEGWHRFDEVRFDYDDPVLKSAGRAIVDAKDARNFRVGGTFRFDSDTELSLGYGYLPRAVPLARTLPAQPDHRAQIFAFGVRRRMGAATVDLGYTHGLSRRERSRAALFAGAYEVRAHLISLSATIPFGESR